MAKLDFLLIPEPEILSRAEGGNGCSVAAKAQSQGAVPACSRSTKRADQTKQNTKTQIIQEEEKTEIKYTKESRMRLFAPGQPEKRTHQIDKNNTSKTDVAPWCYKWIGLEISGWGYV